MAILDAVFVAEAVVVGVEWDDANDCDGDNHDEDDIGNDVVVYVDDNDAVDVEDVQCGISHMSELGLDWMGKNHAEEDGDDDDDGIKGVFFVWEFGPDVDCCSCGCDWDWSWCWKTTMVSCWLTIAVVYVFCVALSDQSMCMW